MRYDRKRKTGRDQKDAGKSKSRENGQNRETKIFLYEGNAFAGTLEEHMAYLS